MTAEGTLTAERPLAQHSDLLGTREPDAGVVIKSLSAKLARLQTALADELADLLGGTRPQVTCGKLEKADAAKLHKLAGPVAANFRLADGKGHQAFASLDHRSALALTDQVFGGPGTWTGSAVERLPVSANLTLTRFVQALGMALPPAFDLPEPLQSEARSDVLGKFISVREADDFIALRVEIAVGESAPWQLLLAWRQAQAARLIDNDRAANAPAGAGDRRRPDAKPFGGIPLPLTAVLARMDVPVSRISGLQPGDTIPLAIGRNVSLKLDDIEIARGEVGASDGAIALRLTSIAWNSPLKGHTHDG